MMMLKLNHKHKNSTLLLFFFLALAVNVKAQVDFKETVKEQLVKDWERAKIYTDEFLQAMPQDKYAFKPEVNAMSFAEQMLHLAKYNYNLGAAATGVASPIGKLDLQKKATSLSRDSVVYYVNNSYDFLIANLKKMDAALLEQKQGTMSRFLTLEKAFEHQTHHRGGLAVYLRLAGVVPPHERLF